MRSLIEPQREIVVVADVDVAVVGGGCAGIAAALAAARNDAQTVLIERLGFLGGCVSATSMSAFTQLGAGDIQVVGGIAHEMAERMLASGNATLVPGHHPGKAHFGYRLNTEYLKYFADVLMEESGVKTMLHTFGCTPIMDVQRVQGLMVENKSGRQAVLAKAVVDCTGDADVAAWAGAPFEMGRPGDGLMQPASNSLNVAGFDAEELGRYYREHPEDWGLQSLVSEARSKGEFTIRRAVSQPSLPHPWGGSSVNVTRVCGVDMTDAAQVTNAEIECRRQIFEEVLPFLRKYAPGCQNARVESVGTQIAGRESRRIVGDYTLTEEDVLLAKKKPDSIGCFNSFLDLHNPEGLGDVLKYLEAKPEEFAQYATYTPMPSGYALVVQAKPGGFFDIPYRSLIPRNVEGLLVAGKNISATHMGVAAIRYLGASMVTGEAAGTAAAMSAASGIEPRKLDIKELQKGLSQRGAILDPQA